MQRTKSVRGWRGLVVGGACVVAGCGPGDTPPAMDAGADAGSACEAPAALPIGNVEGHPSPLGAASGEARAGRVTAADLPPDPADLARWTDGDYVVANDRVALVISQPGRFDRYDPHAGRVRGIARIADGRLVEPADFSIALLGLGRFVVATESVTVLADGSAGGPAVVRAAGNLVPIEAVGDVLSALLPGRLTGFPAALDYTLSPDSDRVEVSVTVRAGASGAGVRGTTAAFLQAYRMPPWSVEGGFGPVTGAPRYVAYEDPESTSYAWLAAPAADGTPGTLRPLLSTSGFDFFTGEAEGVPACDERRYVLGSFVIGADRGLPGVQRALARELGETLRTVRGTLVGADADALTGARIHLTNADGTRHVTRALLDASGSFTLEAPPEATQAWLWREGAPLEGPFAIGSDGAVSITPAALSTVRVTVRDAGGTTPLPARVALFPVMGSPPEAPENFGEVVAGRGRARLAFVGATGDTALRVAPGNYRLVVSRGWEYEPLDQTITLAPGERANVPANLTRAFETPNTMCADYHIHTHRSVDSADSGADKVAALVADGLEIAIRSEHEFVSDFQPLIDTLGLADYARGLGGEELTTFTYGHFGVFPLEPDASRPGGGAVPWFGRNAPEVFAEVRARAESPLLIINHPRAGGLKQGYFTETGYNPATGTVTHPENWDERIDVLEALNASDFESNREGTIRDWFSLLASGRRVMIVGSSDSHRTTGDPVGYPRTCLALGTDDPRTVTPAQVRDATRAGASFVTGGIFLEVSGPMAIGPGGEATGVGPRASLDVVVRAPSFIDVNRLEVLVDGLTTETIPITAADADPLDGTIRLRATLEVDVAAMGSFVILHAAGDEAPDLAYGDRPFAVTNPLFLRR